MELVKRKIKTSEIGKCISDQFIVDDDYNVPDSKADIGRIVLGEGNIYIEEIKRMENYLRVSGKLFFKILYVTDAVIPELESLKGQVPFEEMVYVEAEKEEDFLAQATGVEFSATLIHSRKLAIKAMVDLSIRSDKMREEETTIDIEGAERIFKKTTPMEILQLHTAKRDIYRIKEEFTIPGTKENVGTLIWTDVNLRKIDTKISQDAISFTGTLQVFVFYKSEEEKIDWVEQMVPFEGKISCNHIEEGFYHHIYHSLQDVNVEARLDADGEMRNLGVEATLEMRILVYKEEQVEFLVDAYSLEKQCVLESKMRVYEELVAQNHSKYKFAEKLTLPEVRDGILQICHSGGRIQVENMEVKEEGILIEGILHVHFLYVKADDHVPFDVWAGLLPFSYVVESPRTCLNMRYDVTAGLEQISIEMAGSEEVEVKAVLAFNSFQRCPLEVKTVDSLDFRELDEGEIASRPGIVGYITKEGDDLWTLAKRYNTTEQGIMEVNGLTSKDLKAGEKLLIFKENMSIL